MKSTTVKERKKEILKLRVANASRGKKYDRYMYSYLEQQRNAAGVLFKHESRRPSVVQDSS